MADAYTVAGAIKGDMFCSLSGNLMMFGATETFFATFLFVRNLSSGTHVLPRVSLVGVINGPPLLILYIGWNE